MKCEAMSDALFADDHQALFTGRLRTAAEENAARQSEESSNRDAMQLFCMGK
jgi:hypothetical protein